MQEVCSCKIKFVGFLYETAEFEEREREREREREHCVSNYVCYKLSSTRELCSVSIVFVYTLSESG